MTDHEIETARMSDPVLLVHDQIETAFRALYPRANIIVHNAGEETITVCVQHGTDYLQGFTCELDSDDDGYFRFFLDDSRVCVRIEYPEGL